MTPRTMEVLDQRGIADRFLAAGRVIDVGPGFAGLTMDLRGLPSRHSYVLGLLQYRVERLLVDWVTDLGVDIRYGCEVVAVKQDPHGVDATLGDGTMMRGAYLVGCDGGQSSVRKSIGIKFPGWEASTSCLVADVEMTRQPPWGLHRDGEHHSFFHFDGEDTVRVTVTEPDISATTEPTLADLRTPTSPPTQDVRTIEAAAPPAWRLPTVGQVPAPQAVLVRPDGYIAWTDTSTGLLADALDQWFR